MLKNIVQVSEVIKERDYTFLCANDAPTIDIKEFCYRLLTFVGKIEEQAKAQQEAVKVEEPEALSVTEELVQEPQTE